MKKKKESFKKNEISKDNLEQENGFDQEDLLELDNLLNVQGGKDGEDQNANCGLGCFTGATFHRQEKLQNENESR